MNESKEKLMTQLRKGDIVYCDDEQKAKCISNSLNKHGYKNRIEFEDGEVFIEILEEAENVSNK